MKMQISTLVCTTPFCDTFQRVRSKLKDCRYIVSAFFALILDNTRVVCLVFMLHQYPCCVFCFTVLQYPGCVCCFDVLQYPGCVFCIDVVQHTGCVICMDVVKYPVCVFCVDLLQYPDCIVMMFFFCLGCVYCIDDFY